MAKSIMIQGTMSNVGKSLLVGGLCRILKQDGIKAVPFKSQNMALNSYITRDGLEMGRAQAMQAEAAGIEPAMEMNPILLKPTSDVGSQVILNGEVAGVMSASEYYRHKTEYIPVILEAYRKLEEQYDVIVIEGAGSPSEINLKQNDIVNMGLAKLVDAPVLLAGDIDRGGVFAQIAGTVLLLEEEERARIKGTVINKFRGDKTILEPGLRMLEERTGIPVCGVVPYVHLDIDEEDSLTGRFQRSNPEGLVDIAVIRLPRISNFTDFAPLECRKEVSLRYVESEADFGAPDAVLLPGSKNTIDDLLWLRQSGLEARILRYAGKGGLVFGICGGYQMLGEEILDPDGAESGGEDTEMAGEKEKDRKNGGEDIEMAGEKKRSRKDGGEDIKQKVPREVRGMALLPVRTVFGREKTRTRVKGRFQKVDGILRALSEKELEGYEIHMGATWAEESVSPLVVLQDEVTSSPAKADGAWKGNVYGCYVHGIFDRAEVADAFVCALMEEKGYTVKIQPSMDYHAYKEQQYDLLADVLRENLDMKYIYEVIEKGMDMPCSIL